MPAVIFRITVGLHWETVASRDEDAECTRDTLADYLIVLADHIAERKLGANEALTGIDKLSRMGCMPQADKAEIREWLSGNDSEKIKRYIDELHQRMYIKAEELFARFNDDESDELTQLYPFGLRRREHRYPKEYYADCVRVPFENITIPIPIGYDAMLRKRYGDYLEIYKDVSGHGYPFYESQQAQLDLVFHLVHTESENGSHNDCSGVTSRRQPLPCR